jgi:hypothetical protein
MRAASREQINGFERGKGITERQFPGQTDARPRSCQRLVELRPISPVLATADSLSSSESERSGLAVAPAGGRPNVGQ